MNIDARFDLEQSILSCWNICEELKLLQENILETEMSKDDIANVLMGLEKLFQMKFDKCFKHFEDSRGA